MAGPSVIPLSEAEAREILSAKIDNIPIGGQALAIWANHYEVAPPSALDAGITLDIDFLGTLEEAKATRKKLADAPGTRVDIVPASMDDATPNSAKLLVRNFHSRTDPIEIDFLFGLAGYLPPDEALLRERAVEIELDETPVRAMHPVDCLLSRVRNVERLPEKRGPASIAQCRLAIAVLKAYLTEVCGLGIEAQRRRALKVVERVAELAQSNAGIYLKTEFDIDVLDAVPADRFESQEFRERRWPQIQSLVAGRIATLKRQRERRRKRAKPA